VVAQEASVLALHLPEGGRAEWHCQFETGGEASGSSDGTELQLPALPLGYHRLSVTAAGKSATVTLIVTPPAAYLPEALRPGAHSWGLTTQLYGLRGQGNWGIGDFTELAELCRGVAPIGAATVGLNPLHALFAAEPNHFSPYSPSSRSWLDFLYIDVTKVPGFAESNQAQAIAPSDATAAARATDLVDYRAVARLKRPVLEVLYRRFRANQMANGSTVAADFRAFQRDGGESLRLFAVFEALHEDFTRSGGNFSWHAWPAALQDPQSPEVARFAHAHRERVEFFQFLQWQADRQLGAAARAGQQAGLSIGLYCDFAVGANPHGAEAWSDHELVVPGAAIGAPPDPLSRSGQNWGLAPQNPLVLRRRGFAPFVASLRANMRHAGVLRIDHVMSLQRLYWVPAGAPATAGAYVDYPFRELLRLLALESQRQHCAVIGEDLGTVPDGFREAMAAAQVLSYRILEFERNWDGTFRKPHEYSPLAASSAATHDLATLKGFWLGRDIEWRSQLGNYPTPETAAQEQEARGRDRHLLLEALIGEGLLAPEQYRVFLPESGTVVYEPELGDAILAYLARSRSRLTLVQLEDVVGEVEQANLPGTTDAHPNWRRKLSQPLEAVLAGGALARIAALMNDARRQATPD